MDSLHDQNSDNIRWKRQLRKNEVDVCKIPVVELKMSNMQTDEDLDDLDWFFTEDEPLGTSQNGPPGDLAKEHCKSKNYFDVEVNEVIQQGVQITSLKSREDSECSDDEFEDCFVDIPKVTKSSTFHSESFITRTQLSHDKGPTGSGQALISSALKTESKARAPETFQRIQGSNDDEFDQCFEEKEYLSEQENSQQTEMPNVSHFVEKCEVNLDQLLKNMCSIKSSFTKVKNSSRHFKTIESTLGELTCDIKSNRQCKEAALEKPFIPKTIEKTSDHSTFRDVNKLLSKLKVKSSSSKVLNRSRHYKTFDTTLEELNRSEKSEESPPILKKKNAILVREREQVDCNSFDGIQEITGNQSMDCGSGYQSIARGLSHGCEEVMDVVLQVANRQSQHQDTLK